jgi:archaetidylinositol phosphate synthase
MKELTIPMHVREYRSPLATTEKRILVWLARQMPSYVNSDHLTLLGFLGILLAGISFGVSSRDKRTLLLVVVGLAINWFGDSLDGTLARVRDRQRPRYGYYTDHVLDLIGTSVLVLGMSLSGFMSPLVGFGFLIAYLMVMAEVFLSNHVQRVFRMSFMGFGPTELRILLAVGVLFLFRNPVVRIAGNGPFHLFDVGAIVAIAGLTAALLTSAFHNIRDLYRQETLPRPRIGSR